MSRPSRAVRRAKRFVRLRVLIGWLSGLRMVYDGHRGVRVVEQTAGDGSHPQLGEGRPAESAAHYQVGFARLASQDEDRVVGHAPVPDRNVGILGRPAL